MPICPRHDCDLELTEDSFNPPGSYSCPNHGGPIWLQSDLELDTSLYWLEETHSASPFPIPVEGLNELAVMTRMFSRLAAKGELVYSVSRDISGRYPTVLTIENHGSESIDVQMLFSPEEGKLVGVICFRDV